MQRILTFALLFLVSSAGFAQDWDDFEPPPPADFGNIPPPPPPPPMNDFDPPPTPDFRPPPPNFSTGNGGDSGGSGGRLSMGAVRFKKTGEKKDLNQMNPRIEELLEEDRKLNGGR